MLNDRMVDAVRVREPATFMDADPVPRGAARASVDERPAPFDEQVANSRAVQFLDTDFCPTCGPTAAPAGRSALLGLASLPALGARDAEPGFRAVDLPDGAPSGACDAALCANCSASATQAGGLIGTILSSSAGGSRGQGAQALSVGFGGAGAAASAPGGAPSARTVAFYGGGCAPISRPDVTSLLFFTQDCLGTTSWPADDCDTPCLDPRPCELPSPDEIAILGQTMSQIVVTPQTATKLPDWWVLIGDVLEEKQEALDEAVEDLLDSLPLQAGDQPGSDAFLGVERYEDRIADAQEFIGAAVALMNLNADLLSWAVCLVATYTPNFSDEERALFVEAVNDAIYVQAGPSPGRRNIYLIDSWPENADGGMPTGGATDLITFYLDRNDPGTLLEGNGGPVIPIGIAYWRKTIRQYKAGGPKALCAIAAMAGVLLHELIHLLAEAPVIPDKEPPGAANDDDSVSCWAIQNMAASAFMWALGQRYSCMQDAERAHCCRMTQDRRFLSPETDGLSEGLPFEPDKCT